MNIKDQVKNMDAMVSQGDIVNAVKKYFATNANTSDYENSTTNSKTEMVAKMEGFLGAISNVNGIKHHKTIVDGTNSASEFTFDFDMKDGSKIYWHEIIQREWNDQGQVIKEEYFNAN
ncbi:hypothetical protein [Tenacibaculum sp. 190524A05c]|uniref:hypothetical protein n=1 Tax=Tenacibaculum platacis TaxID=3137852 RepID=UPI0031FADA6E